MKISRKEATAWVYVLHGPVAAIEYGVSLGVLADSVRSWISYWCRGEYDRNLRPLSFIRRREFNRS